MNCQPSLKDVSKAPTLILSLLSSSENYTSLVLTIPNMHALYTFATFLTGLNETNRSIKTNSPSAMNTLTYLLCCEVKQDTYLENLLLRLQVKITRFFNRPKML